MKRFKQWFRSVPVQFILILFFSLFFAGILTLDIISYIFTKGVPLRPLFASEVGYNFTQSAKEISNAEALMKEIEEYAQISKSQIWLFNEEGKVIKKSKDAPDSYPTINEVDKSISSSTAFADWYREAFISHGKLYYLFVNREWGPTDVTTWNIRLLWFVGMFLIFILMVIVTYHLLIRRKMKQLKDIFQGVALMKEEQGEVVIRKRTKDQFGDLAVAINDMYRSVLSSKKQAIALEKQKNELITNMAHDLRTPLTTILGYLQLLKEGEVNPVYVERSYEQAQRLKGLTDDLFELAKLQSMEQLQQKETVNVPVLLYQLADKWEPLLEDRKLHLEIDEQPASIQGNTELLVRLFDNLFSNVKKHGLNQGEVLLQSKVEQNTLMICLCNEAEGIKEEELNHLFDRFYVGDTSRSNSESSGIGLAIVKQIVYIHHGRVNATLKDDKLCITIILQKGEDR